MTQSLLNRAVADATGETVREIRRRGFGPVDNDYLVDCDPDPDDISPQMVDWDALALDHYALFPAT